MNILITVDYQGDFANPQGKLYVPGAETIANIIQKNINDDFFDKHIMTFDTHTKEEYFNSPEHTDYKFDIHCEFGTDGWKPYDIVPRTKVPNFKSEIYNSYVEQAKEVFFCKDKFDIWEGNALFEHYISDNISKSDNIFIQGVATNYCVFMNAIGFAKRGYNVYILENAIKAIEDGSAEATIRTMKENGIVFISSENNAIFYEKEIEFLVNKAKKFFHIKDIDSVIKKLKSQIFDYVQKNNLQSLVIGVSGGLDSAVVAALCKDVGVPVIGVSIPIDSSEDHIEKARWVGKNYCDFFEENTCWQSRINDISRALQGSEVLIEMAGFQLSEYSNKISQGNMKARLRMMTLYDIARKTNGMVMSTDNLSEFNMGFWTLHGDVGDYGLIQNLNKGFEIPQIARALGIREDIISQPPSDGLMVTPENTDEAQLGASYQEIDAILEFGGNMNNPKIKKILDRYNAMAFKRNGVVNVHRYNLYDN